MPVPADGLEIDVLHDAPPALLVPAAHRLVGEESVTPRDFAHEPLVARTGVMAAWTDFRRLATARTAAPPGPARAPDGGVPHRGSPAAPAALG
ncbi:LysR substrate-binding domain-containing protein [Streptomyces sp. NPDC004031]